MLKKKLSCILAVVTAVSVLSTVGFAQTEETKLFGDTFENGLSSDIWNTVHTGMNLAAGTYSAFSSLKMSIAAKTGTAQEKTTDPDHATLITYAPYENPEYCMAVRIQNGYASGNAVTLGADIYKMLFNISD